MLLVLKSRHAVSPQSDGEDVMRIVSSCACLCMGSCKAAAAFHWDPGSGISGILSSTVEHVDHVQDISFLSFCRLAKLRGLYKGVVGAASAAGIIIGTYFAFYSTSKRLLRRHSNLNEGKTANPFHAKIGTGCSSQEQRSLQENLSHPYIM